MVSIRPNRTGAVILRLCRGPGSGSGHKSVTYRLQISDPGYTRLAHGRSVAQPGRALPSGGRGRRFDSYHSDQCDKAPDASPENRPQRYPQRFRVDLSGICSEFMVQTPVTEPWKGFGFGRHGCALHKKSEAGVFKEPVPGGIQGQDRKTLTPGPPPTGRGGWTRAGDRKVRQTPR